MTSLDTVTAGFLPLTDCMLLVAAKEKGFAENAGIDLRLSKETSWASIRDHIAVGHYEVAHMLAPMPIAFNSGLAPFSVPVIAPMALGLGGNAITVSTELWNEMQYSTKDTTISASEAGEAIKQLVLSRKSEGMEKLRFGVVHPFSGHNFELRYWLSSCGVSPENDIEILIIPPPLMSDALKTGKVDGYCVGEPWNSVSVERGHGCILTTKSEIWHSSPEKVLGVATQWAEKEPQSLQALIQAIHEAAKWCSAKHNHAELAEILAQPDYIAVSAEIIIRGLDGKMTLADGHTVVIDDFLIPSDRAANFPWQSHALWFYTQMVRWGLIEHSQKNAEIAKNAYRPDIYRSALLQTDAAIPAANMKVEGALKVPTSVGSTGRLTLGPDGFFDNLIFDPDNLDKYLSNFT